AARREGREGALRSNHSRPCPAPSAARAAGEREAICRGTARRKVPRFCKGAGIPRPAAAMRAEEGDQKRRRIAVRADYHVPVRGRLCVGPAVGSASLARPIRRGRDPGLPLAPPVKAPFSPERLVVGTHMIITLLMKDLVRKALRTKLLPAMALVALTSCLGS